MAPVLETSGLVVKDDRGVVRARIGFVSEDQGYVGLTLYDRDGQSRICISTAGGGRFDRATLLINDPDGRRRAVLNVGREGTGLRLFDESERPRVSLGCSKRVGTRLALVGANGEIDFSVPEGRSGPSGSVEGVDSTPQ